uniref:Uncharacterized protein n=2 Tax=Aegilops tauschii subsp. strangulata TaxID=200361 RepID=A0A453JAT1_AEGTS
MQIYAWIGCNSSAKFGHLYAAAATRPGNGVSVTSVLGGTSDNTGSSMARRLGTSVSAAIDPPSSYIGMKNTKLTSPHVSVLKTGLNIILACNIPKDSPMLEVLTRTSSC